MSLGFAIIPCHPEFKQIGESIRQKMLSRVQFDISFAFDYAYTKSMDARTRKMRKIGYDNIIKINNNDGKINVIFEDDGSIYESIDIDEFIDLVVSYDPSSEVYTDEDKDNDTPKELEQTDKGCVIN